MKEYSAVGLGIRLLIAIGMSELVIMLMLQTAGLSTALSADVKAVVDVLLLSVISGTLIWFWLVRPLKDALERNTELASVVSNTSIGVLICNPEPPFKITFVNRGFEALSGVNKEAAEGRGAFDIIGPESYNKICRDVQHACGHKVRLENCLLPLSATECVVDITASPVIDATGELSKIVLLITDVTDRYRKQVEMRRLLSAIEQSGEAVVITDKTGRIEYVNPSFTAITGYSSAQAVGLYASIRSCSGDSCDGDPVLDLIHAGAAWAGRLIKQRKDGSEYDELTTISPVYDGNTIAHYVIIQRDVSEEVALNAQLIQSQRLEAVGTLTSGLAHDFNNSLAGILGNLYLLRRNIQDEPSLERINTIERLANHSSEIIKQLLTFSRNANDETVDFSLAPIVIENSKIYDAGIPENIQVVIEAEDGIDLPVRGSPGKVQQVVMNLITNAAYAIGAKEKGRIYVKLERLTTSLATPEGSAFLKRHDIGAGVDLAHLLVEDNGSGMAKNIQHKVFSPFFTTKPPGEGTGLGLAMCYGIITAMNGIIEVSSNEGEGTRFDIYFPLQAETTMRSADRNAASLLAGVGQTILVVDDHLSLRMVNKEVLELWGYKVLLADDGNNAIETFRRHANEITMILMDITMPNLGGVAAAREIRKINADVPVVFVTGYNNEACIGDIRAMKKTRLLSKPYLPETLVHIIQEPFSV